jgi:hypothetical protein
LSSTKADQVSAPDVPVPPPGDPSDSAPAATGLADLSCFADIERAFPHARSIRRNINKRFAQGMGYPISARKLMQILLRLGNTNPGTYISRLNEEKYLALELGGWHYGRLVKLARECAVLAASTRSDYLTRSLPEAEQSQGTGR